MVVEKRLSEIAVCESAMMSEKVVEPTDVAVWMRDQWADESLQLGSRCVTLCLPDLFEIEASEIWMTMVWGTPRLPGNQ